MKNIAFISSKGGHLGQIRMIFTDEVIGKSETPPTNVVGFLV